MKRKLILLFLATILAVFVGCTKNNETVPDG